MSKSMAEDILLYLAGAGLRVCILRPSSVYGVGLARNKLVTKFLSLALQGSTIELVEPIDDEVDLLHAADLAEAALEALEHQAWGVYNVSSERPITIQKIAEACVSVAGRGQIVVKPDPVGRRRVSRFLLNSEKARRGFQFSPKYSLEAGLEGMVHEMGEIL